MDVFRCRICREHYIGLQKPSRCSFCGAHDQHIVPAAEYNPAKLEKLSLKSRENLNQVLEMEADNSRFYRAAAKVADSPEGKGLFKALAGEEAEHAVIICKVLDVPVPAELYEMGESFPEHGKNLAESRRREERSVALYAQFMEEAVEARVREILEAFIEVESDHLGFSL